MNKILIIIVVVIVLAGGGFFLYSRMQNNTPSTSTTITPSTPTSVATTTPVVSCTPAQGETAFNGKVVSVSGQYTLQASDGTTYYLRPNDAQSASLKNKLNKKVQVNGILVTPNSRDVNVTTVCP